MAGCRNCGPFRGPHYTVATCCRVLIITLRGFKVDLGMVPCRDVQGLSRKLETGVLYKDAEKNYTGCISIP